MTVPDVLRGRKAETDFLLPRVSLSNNEAGRSLAAIRKMVVRCCLGLVVALCLSTAQADENVLMGAGDPWPPYTDPDMPKQGVAVEIVTAALGTQGMGLEWQNMAWAKAMYGVRDLEFDVLAAAWYTDERAEFLLYSEPYIDNDVRVIIRHDDPFEFTGIEALEGKRVGTVLGYGYGDEFNRAENYIPDPSVNLITNVRKLVRRRVDLTLGGPVPD